MKKRHEIPEEAMLAFKDLNWLMNIIECAYEDDEVTAVLFNLLNSVAKDVVGKFWELVFIHSSLNAQMQLSINLEEKCIEEEDEAETLVIAQIPRKSQLH